MDKALDTVRGAFSVLVKGAIISAIILLSSLDLTGKVKVSFSQPKEMYQKDPPLHFHYKMRGLVFLTK